MEFIKQNLAEVEERICAACKRAGRAREEVTLIAVSKTKPVEMLEACMENGITIFGENKVQELCEKYEVLPKDLHWHLIGHLQRNKVKYITDKAELIHSVDSLRLAQAISDDAVKKGVNVDILLYYAANVRSNASAGPLEEPRIFRKVPELYFLQKL